MIEKAISQLEAEVLEVANSRPGTPSWLVWQARSLGLSFLKKAQQDGYDQPEDVDRLRKSFRRRGMEEGTIDVAADRVEAAKTPLEDPAGASGVS